VVIKRSDVLLDDLFERLQILLSVEVKQSAVDKFTKAKTGAEVKFGAFSQHQGLKAPS